jgi:hypothetical protein
MLQGFTQPLRVIHSAQYVDVAELFESLEPHGPRAGGHHEPTIVDRLCAGQFDLPQRAVESNDPMRKACVDLQFFQFLRRQQPDLRIVHLALQIALRERRPVIGQMRFVA